MKYLKNGQAVEVISEIPTGGGFVVDVYLEDSETGETFLDGEPEIVDKVYDSVPIYHKAKEFVELQEKIDRLRSELLQVQHETRDAEKERSRLLDRLKQVPGLQRIEDFIDGKFTHLVSEQYGRVHVIAKEELVCDDDGNYKRKPSRMKLITLFGDTDGNLEFHVNKYRDGSGSSDYVATYHCSEDEAKAKAGELLIGIMEEAYSAGGHHLAYAIDSAEKIGMAVPEKYMALYRERLIESATKELSDADARREAARAKLAVLQQGQAGGDNHG